jgi:hypothetical protein
MRGKVMERIRRKVGKSKDTFVQLTNSGVEVLEVDFKTVGGLVAESEDVETPMEPKVASTGMVKV